MGPWHLWYAWHPVRTRYHGWTWCRTVYRRQIVLPDYSVGAVDVYWEYEAIVEDDHVEDRRVE